MKKYKKIIYNNYKKLIKVRQCIKFNTIKI